MEWIPSKETFELIQSSSYEQIVQLPPDQTRLILPCLVRMSLCETLDVSDRWRDVRKRLKKHLLGFFEVNELLCLLHFNYAELEADVKKEMQFRFKQGAAPGDSILLAGINQQHGLIRAFESGDPRIRLRIVLSELIQLMNVARSNTIAGFQSSGPYPSELFDADIYFFSILDLLYFAISELPNTFQLIEVVEALLLLKNGLQLICCLLGNFADSFHEICMALITNGTVTEEDGYFAINRVRVLRKLCQMNPNEALLIRGEAVELCRMPNLVVMLTLDHLKQVGEKTDDREAAATSGLANSKTDVVSFITGILLSNDHRIQSWFAAYIKSNQKRSTKLQPGADPNSFLEFRAVLLARFKAVTEQVATLSAATATAKQMPSTEAELILTEACIMLRLYCALRGVASMKFTDEETLAICRMIICRPRHSYIGVRFVSLGLCMILAFPQLVTASENESKIVDWIKWLVQEESYLGKVAGMKSSFGEMLLLIAIHFHSNQMSAIGELVSTTIGIKLPIRINDLNRIKNIFTGEIFTEQTVAAHAVKVPVTRHLNNTVSGFLPVHCIYQLLKSRVFTKNKVPIKDWIFKQVRNSVAPIHQILPQLIEAYVNSILVPNTASYHLTNEPIAEEDMAGIFSRRVYEIEEAEEGEEEESGSEEEAEEEAAAEKMDVDEEETEDEADGSGGSLRVSEEDDEVACVLTSQLLLLYYVLLYEDVRLANMKNILLQERKVLKYSEGFLAQLPIFYLVQQTRMHQLRYGVLMPPLLKLIAFHYPHLCLVKDWLPRSTVFTKFITPSSRGAGSGHSKKSTICTRREREKFLKAFKTTKSGALSYTAINDAFERLLHLPDEYLWPLAPEFVGKLPTLLRDSVPRVVTMSARSVWFRLNHIFPTKLWLMTVNALSGERSEAGRHYSTVKKWSEVVEQPLCVFDCDRRVFRTPDLMEVLLHILSGLLSAAKMAQTHFLMEYSRTIDDEKKRDELNLTLQSLTESSAIQLLLECCRIREEDFARDGTEEETTGSSSGSEEDDDEEEEDQTRNVEPRGLSNLKEVQGLICSHLHQCFIADVNLAKLVHFQGYRKELLPMVVKGIPSMHICLDFLPELLSQPELEKQSFAFDLCSHLCLEYPIQRFYNVAKLCLAMAVTHLSVLPSIRRADFYLAILPPLQRMCQVFPPLIEDFVRLLVALGQKNQSRLCAHPTMLLAQDMDCFTLGNGGEGSASPELVAMEWSTFEREVTAKMEPEEALSLTIHKAFGMLCELGPISKVFREEVAKK